MDTPPVTASTGTSRTSTSRTNTSNTATALNFPHHLRAWRKRRRLSQLELALQCRVSQRHLSFLESGRARPSRGMILHLAETLEVPLRDRNQWLLAAGFAPVFPQHSIDHPVLQQVLHAVDHMLTAHAPFPAVAVDRSWNVVRMNAPFSGMLARLGVVASPESPLNLLRLLFAPDGIRPHVRNFPTIAPLLWQRAMRESQAAGGEDVTRLLAELEPSQDPATIDATQHIPLLPVLPLCLQAGDAVLSLFSVISTFGTPQDITTGELRLETFFPADESTRHFLVAMPSH